LVNIPILSNEFDLRRRLRFFIWIYPLVNCKTQQIFRIFLTRISIFIHQNRLSVVAKFKQFIVLMNFFLEKKWSSIYIWSFWVFFEDL